MTLGWVPSRVRIDLGFNGLGEIDIKIVGKHQDEDRNATDLVAQSLDSWPVGAQVVGQLAFTPKKQLLQLGCFDRQSCRKLLRPMKLRPVTFLAKRDHAHRKAPWAWAPPDAG